MAMDKRARDYCEAFDHGRHLPGNMPTTFATWYADHGVHEGFTNPGAALLFWWPTVTPDCFAVTVHAKYWARFPEVLAYAQRRGIDTEEAIIELTNSGLSHQPVEVTR